MPAPFNKVLYRIKVNKYFGKGNLSPVDERCLRELIRKIHGGQEIIRPHRAIPSFYLPKIGCNHEIILSEDRKNNLFVDDIRPLTISTSIP